jgi:membrane peptidoglycan carboxypeptidase
MNPYGDPQSARARAGVPGSSPAPAPDDSSRPAPDAYRRGTTGRATVSGVVPRGAASVGGGTRGAAPVGGTSRGSASVGGTTGRAAVGAARPADPYGPPGRAAARASVTPVSPAVAGGPAGPRGPHGEGPSHNVRGSANKILSKAAKRRRRTNILTAAAAVGVILLGGGVVAGTYFVDGVDLPPQRTESQSNVILDTNGKLLAKFGSQNRTVVPETKINKIVEHAVAAAEDKNFYHHHGIDMRGIARAAWNNFTGGTTEGASTITQQYARHAADLKEISYNRKLREAVIARKLEDNYTKDQIMGMYLNYIYLGEGQYGIEAAAQGYFHKSVMTPAGSKNAITPDEAAVLASIIRQPEPSATFKGYDPNVSPENAKLRWEYTMKNMLEMNWITQAQYDARQYPAKIYKPSETSNSVLDSKPVGMIMRHVKAELAEHGISQNEFNAGGLTITTTINPKVQALAEEAGSEKSKSSPMYGRPKTYQAAVIGIDPNTGAVLGYYGGDDPTGTDYGSYLNGSGTGFSGTGQSPGSSFKIYTLSAALKENISFKTTWDGTKKRPGGKPISNAGADPGTVCGGNIKNCDLETATIKSYNFPFYWIADGIGRDKVIQAAKDAGIRHMWTDSGKMVDLDATTKTDWLQSGVFDNEVAFGQYHVVPLEHAEGVATVVNGGTRYDAHFIQSVTRVNPDNGKKDVVIPPKVEGKKVFDSAQMSDLEGVMGKVVKADDRDLKGGREGIAKSGTWEQGKGSGDCWFVGGIPQMAVTVWVGGAKDRVELKEKNGKDMFGAGTPSRIWKQFIDATAEAMNWDNKDFPPRQHTGDDNSSFQNGQKPPPQPQQPDQNCFLNFLCPNGQNNGGQNNGGQNNGGQGNGNGQNNGGQGNGTGQNNGGQGNGTGQNNGGQGNGTGQGTNQPGGGGEGNPPTAGG